LTSVLQTYKKNPNHAPFSGKSLGSGVK